MNVSTYRNVRLLIALVFVVLALVRCARAEIAHYSGGSRTTGDTHIWAFTVDKGTATFPAQYMLRRTGQAWYDGDRVTINAAGVITENATFNKTIQQSGVAGNYTDQITYEWTTKTHVVTYDGVYNMSGVLVKALTAGSTVVWTVANDGAAAATVTSNHTITLAGADAPVPDKLKVIITGKSYATSEMIFEEGLVESAAFNHVFGVPAVPLGAAPGTFADLSRTYNETHPTPGYFSGKNVYAKLVGSGGTMAEATCDIPEPDANGDRQVTINFGDFGKVIAPPAPPTPTGTQTNTGNATTAPPLPPTPPTTPPSSTGQNGAAAVTTPAGTAATNPLVANTPNTAVNNGSTTISGTANGATTQDVYNAFKAALMDAGGGGKGAGGGASGPGTGGGAAFADGDFEDPTAEVTTAVNGVKTARSGVIASLSEKVAVNPLASLPTSFGSGPSSVQFFNIAGTVGAVDLTTPYANSLFATIRACSLFALAVSFAMGMVYTVRRYV